MNPQLRLRFAWLLLIVSLIAWPVTAMTVFKNEPQGILGLSWFAITLTAFDILITTDVRSTQEDEDDD